MGRETHANYGYTRGGMLTVAATLSLHRVPSDTMLRSYLGLSAVAP